MANAFDFELKADDQVSASIQRIDEAVETCCRLWKKPRQG